jgi:hypothetical protein
VAILGLGYLKFDKRMERKVFRSRVSVLSLMMIVVIFIIPMVLLKNIICTIVFGGVCLLVLTIPFNFRYIIEDNQLIVKGCGVDWYISIKRVISIERHYTILPFYGGGVSIAYRRLKIKAKNAEYPYYSFTPANERIFVETLKEINPNMKVDIYTKPKVWWRFWDWDI